RMRDGVTIFVPIEGYALKFKQVNQEVDPELEPSYIKAFINVYHSPDIPEPSREVSPHEIIHLMNGTTDHHLFDIPFVLCKFVDVVIDKSNENSMKFDVSVSSSFYEKYLEDIRGPHRRFLTSKICEAIKESFHFVVNHWEAIYLNRKTMGDVPDAQALEIFQWRKNMISEIKKPAPSPQKKPMVTISDESTPIDEEPIDMDGEYMPGGPDLYTIPQNDRVRIRIIDGKKLEIRIKVYSFDGLRLTMSRDHLSLRNRFKSIVDFHYCIPIDKTKAKTIIHEEAKMLDVIVPIDIPHVEW
ncbi:hypothetical protein PFISCL1PPCAC_1788, partial [Pristionchus fissidentatus]